MKRDLFVPMDTKFLYDMTFPLYKKYKFRGERSLDIYFDRNSEGVYFIEFKYVGDVKKATLSSNYDTSMEMLTEVLREIKKENRVWKVYRYVNIRYPKKGEKL